MSERTHYKSLIDSDWLGQWDLVDSKTGRQLEATVQIESVRRYKPARVRQKKMTDPVTRQTTWVDEKNKRLDIAFVGKRKHWLAGPESQTIIAALYGNIIQDWIGKRLTLFVDPNVTMGRGQYAKKVGGIRPKKMIPGSNVPLTEETLDEPVDEQKAEDLEEAFASADADEKDSPG